MSVTYLAWKFLTAAIVAAFSTPSVGILALSLTLRKICNFDMSLELLAWPGIM